jgi:hypothetical protein
MSFDGWRWAVPCALLAMGCGSDGGSSVPADYGTFTVTADRADFPLNAVSCAAMAVEYETREESEHWIELSLVDWQRTPEQFVAGVSRAGSTQFSAYAHQSEAIESGIPEGMYPFEASTPDGRSGNGGMVVLDATCGGVRNERAQRGTIEYRSIGAKRVKGRVDADFAAAGVEPNRIAFDFDCPVFSQPVGGGTSSCITP